MKWQKLHGVPDRPAASSQWQKTDLFKPKQLSDRQETIRSLMKLSFDLMQRRWGKNKIMVRKLVNSQHGGSTVEITHKEMEEFLVKRNMKIANDRTKMRMIQDFLTECANGWLW